MHGVALVAALRGGDMTSTRASSIVGTRFCYVVLLATLVALLPRPAAADGTPTPAVLLKQAIVADGEPWVMTILGTTSGYQGQGGQRNGEHVSVTFEKRVKRRTPDGGIAYSLVEMHRYDFMWLDEGTVDIDKDSLTGTIDLGDQHAGLFEANIRFGKIEGEPPEFVCGDSNERRRVSTTAESSLMLKTDHPALGTVTTVPQEGEVSSVNAGECDLGAGCPVEGLHMYGKLREVGGGEQADRFRWMGIRPDEGPGQIEVQARWVIATDATRTSRHSGRVQRWRIDIEPNLSHGDINFNGLPRLSGKANLMRQGEVFTHEQGCRRGPRMRLFRWRIFDASQSGDLTYRPRGGETMSLDPLTSPTLEKRRATLLRYKEIRQR